MAEYYLNFDLEDSEPKDYPKLKNFLEKRFEKVEDGDLASSFVITAEIDDEREMRRRLKSLFRDGDWKIKFEVCYSDDQKGILNMKIWRGIIELNRKLDAIRRRGWYERPE